jgi:hypothetical protein
MSTVTVNILIISGVSAVIFIISIVFWARKQLHMVYNIEAGGEKRIEIVTNAKWRQTEIWFDGSRAATLPQKELSSGYDLPISDGSTLNFKLAKFAFQPHRLQITRNGEPIYKTITSYDNPMFINNAAYMVYIVAIINLAVGIVSVFTQIDAFSPFKFGWSNIIFGAIFLVLGFFAQRRTFVALILFIMIFGVDSFYAFVSALGTGNYFLFLIFFMRLIFLGPAFLGLGEIFRRKTKAVSTLFNVAGAILMIVALVGCCVFVAWSISKLATSVKQLTTDYPNLLPHPAALSASLPKKSTVLKGDSCYLKIKDTAEFVNMRDKADNSTGKVVDYLDKNDVAVVLGNDSGSPGNEWWYVKVEHKGITNQGWVTGKWVKFEDDANCLQVQQIATPYSQ